MRAISFAWLLFAALIAAGTPAQAARKVPLWGKSYSRALKASKSSGRPMFLFFTDNKKWSKRVERTALKDRVVRQGLRNRFIGVKLRGKKNYTAVKMFSVTNFPAYRFVSPDEVILLKKSGGHILGDNIEYWMTEAEGLQINLNRLHRKVETNPRDFRSALDLIKEYWRLGEDNASIAAYDKIIKIFHMMQKDPGRNFRRYAAWSHAALADRYVKARLPKLALPHIKRYRELDPRNKFNKLAYVLLAEAQMLRKKKRYLKVVELLERPAKKFKKDPGADELWFELGLARYLSGDVEGGFETLQEMTERYPTSNKVATANKMIANILVDQEEAKEEARARKRAEKTRKKNRKRRRGY